MWDLPILTKRLALRALRESDATKLYFTVTEPSILSAMPGWDIDRETAIQMAASYTEEHLSLAPGSEHILLAVTLRHSGEFIGLVGINDAPDLVGEPEVQVLLSERHRMCGYSSEALRAMSAWAFAHSELPYLSAIVFPQNHLADHALCAAGFELLGKIELPPESRMSRPYFYYRLDRPQAEER